jgi:hypothetical protein
MGFLDFPGAAQSLPDCSCSVLDGLVLYEGRWLAGVGCTIPAFYTVYRRYRSSRWGRFYDGGFETLRL